MGISGVNSAAATFSFNEASSITKDQMELLLAANAQVKQAPLNQKMVENVNAAIQNTRVDVYA